MNLISVILVLAVVGLILWLVNTYIPMQPPIKQILNVLVVICVILWLLGIFLGGVPSITIGPVHRG